VKLARIAGVVTVVGLFWGVVVACGSSGGVAGGGSCYVATDCIEGFYCYGVTATKAGTCTNNAAKSQPPAAGPPPDGGDIEGGLPGVDGMPSEDGAIPTETGTDAPPPQDTGATDTGKDTKD